MRFKEKETNKVRIITLSEGCTFIDPEDFGESQVFMVIKKEGYDCSIDFDEEYSIAAINLTTGELWSYNVDDEVVQVFVEEITYTKN